MTRPSDAVWEIKSKVNIATFAADHGMVPNAKGFILCPFHGEKTASLKLYDDNSFYCFGCHAHGDIVDFAKELYGLDFKGTLRQLSKEYNLKLFGETASIYDSTPFERALARERKNDARQTEEAAQKEYFDALDRWLTLKALWLKYREQPGFMVIGKHYHIAEIMLDMAEGRRDSICWHNRKTTSSAQ